MRWSSTVHTPSTASTIGIIHGTPSRVPRFARLTLQMETTTTATMAIAPILISVRLAGGATNPLVRRRESANHMSAPRPATTRPATTHEVIGSIVPHIRL